MNVLVVPVVYDEKEILRNLLEKYDYEFSQYDNRDVNALGLYGYYDLDNFWTDENKFPFFIKVDDKLAGFAMICKNVIDKGKYGTDYGVYEFFVMYKYRRMGVGTKVMEYIFDKFKGKWQIGYIPKNKDTKNFWIKVVGKYTNDKYELITDNNDFKYADGTLGEELVFEIL